MELPMVGGGMGDLEFRILGPMEVWRNGRQCLVAAAKQRVLLAVLLLRGNQVVPVGRLMDELWGDQPPPTARNTLQSLVLRLRRILAIGSPAHDAAEILVGRPRVTC
jgi:DNA-binding SARP family transcriptional activator